MSRIKSKMVDQTKLITMAEYAKQQGLTRGRISQMVSNDQIPYVEVKGTKLIYLD